MRSNTLTRVSNNPGAVQMYDEDDLLRRYPEVKKVLDIHPEWGEQQRKNKVFFACHAVSLHGRNMRDRSS